MVDLKEIGIRNCTSDPDRGKRNRQGDKEARDAVHGNRRRIKGRRGKSLLRKRGELVERSFAHVCEPGGMRHTHLRGYATILERLLVHVAGFNLSLLMRHLFGVSKPRTLQDASAALLGTLLRFCLVHSSTRTRRTTPRQPPWQYLRLWTSFAQPPALNPKIVSNASFSTG